MTRRITLILGVVVLIAALRPIYLLGVNWGLWQPVTRPVTVSSRARYVSTFERAAWFDCSIARSKDVNMCRAWDTDGNLMAFGNYRLDGENRAASALELRPSQVQPYPGHPNLARIYLFGDHREILGRTLVPVNDRGDPLERFEVTIGNDR